MKLAKGTALVTGLALAGGCGDDPPSRPELTAWRAAIPGFIDLLFRVDALDECVAIGSGPTSGD